MKLGTLVVLVVMVLLMRSLGAFRPAAASVTNAPIALQDAPSIDRPADDKTQAPQSTAAVAVSSPSDAAALVQPPSPPPQTTPTAPANSSPPPPAAPPIAPRSTYRDGTYYAVGNFSTPGDVESIGVTLVLSGDVIVDSAITAMANHPTSVNYERNFIAGYKQFVVGKKIDQLQLGKVSGASLTSAGFNKALDKIELQARI